jgi:TonB family protein
MSAHPVVRVLRNSLLFLPLVLTPASSVRPAFAQDAIDRKVKTRVSPTYPEIARKMGLTGTVKFRLTVASNGTVKETKVIGGHPILVNAAMDAVKKWKFETASAESTGTVEFKFNPGD